MNRRIIGLTGGIATGKSTVADYLARRYHLPVLDADVYAREAVEPGAEILHRLVQRYGENILLGDRSLNRARLGDIVFRNLAEKQWLEQQIHPFVRERFRVVSASYPEEQPLVYAIPLLFEANLTHLVTEIWVVFCTQEQQLERLMRRNALSLAQAQSRIDSQLPLADKIEQADVVLNNSQEPIALFQQIDHYIDQYSDQFMET
jgi:dephospho-CoA kinase